MKSRTIFIAPMLLSLFLGLSQQANFAASPEDKTAQSAEDALKVQSLIIEGQSNYTHGRYRDAVRAFEQAKALGTSSDYQKANLALGLAEAYRSSGKYKEAEELFKSAIAQAQQDDKKHLNKKYKAGRQRSSDLIPTMMSDLSALYLDQSRFPECEQIVKQSIEMGTKKVGANNINLALPLNGLTRLYLKWGKLNEAKNVSDRTLLLFKTPASKNNMLYAYTAFNIAQITNAKGKYKQAEQLYKATLTGIESLIGFDHEYCATVLEPLGELYRKESRYAEAKKAFGRVCKIRELTLSKEHPDYGKALLNLALVCADEGRYTRANELCQQATKIIQEALGENNVEIAKCWITEASISRYQGRYAEAEELARRALQLDEKLLTADHPAVAHDMVELANILADEEKFAEAEELLNKSLKISQATLGDDHSNIANTIHSLAGIYLAQKDYAKAEPMYRKSLELAQNSLGNENSQVANDLRDLSELFVAQKKYDEAEALLKRALDIDQILFGRKSPQLARDLTSLANLLNLQNKKNLAEPLLAQAAEITANLPGGWAVQKYASSTLCASTALDKSVADKWALVIGISNFKDPSINLKYAAKDATDFRNFLIGKENFRPDHVQLLTDKSATKEKIISNLGDGWLGKLARKDDLVLVYVSSHGSASQEQVGVNFLVAHDTDKNKLISTGLPMQWLTKIIQEQVQSNRVVVILDVCHSGSAGDQSKDISDIETDDGSGDSQLNDAASKGLKRATGLDMGGLNLGSGQVVLCSSLADQVSWESKNYRNSVFTRRLIESLQCNGKATTLRQAYEQLRSLVGSEVLSDRSAVQTPNLYNKNWLGGDPVLALPATRPRAGKVQ
jgi:tetratricopeptide (TPR) repeat protein